jgi:glycosyltransferase involved in cell wall biosynthesis
LVLAISDATRADARSLLGIPHDKLVRVHNGVDVQRWAAAPTCAAQPTLERFGLSQRDFLLYVGGSDWRKNVEGMLGGLALARARGLDLDLVWAGHLGAGHVAAIEEEARRFGVAGSLRRLGYVRDEELSVLYRAARAHLFVSRYEGFGLTVVEAMAAGCPVITTRDGALAEVAGDAALTVEPDDHPAIADAIVRVCRDRELRAELVRRGRERAPVFSREAQAREMVRIYREFLQR